MARSLTKLTLTAVVFLLACGSARTEPITFSYSYDLTQLSSIPEHGTTIKYTSTTGGAEVTGTAALGSATPVALAPLRIVTGGTPPAQPVAFTGTHDTLSFYLMLRDVATGEQALLTLSADLTGLLGYDSSTLVARYTTLGLAEAHLGGRVYRIRMPDEVPVPPWSVGSVEVNPLLTVSAASPSEQAPEPSTLALSAAAALGLAGRRWLRRKRMSPRPR
ncbi:MAG: PEP-CTERM sorting domain-containing protein [Gemmataceae bacterium]